MFTHPASVDAVVSVTLIHPEVRLGGLAERADLRRVAKRPSRSETPARRARFSRAVREEKRVSLGVVRDLADGHRDHLRHHLARDILRLQNVLRVLPRAFASFSGAASLSSSFRVACAPMSRASAAAVRARRR